MVERRTAAEARPWLRFDDDRTKPPRTQARTDDRPRGRVDDGASDEPRRIAHADDPSGFETTRHVLPPERPFAGDDRDTLELLVLNAIGAQRRKRRVRRVGWLIVVAVVAAAIQPVIERLLGAG